MTPGTAACDRLSSERRFLARGEYAGMIGFRNMFNSGTNALREIDRNLDYSICRMRRPRVLAACARSGRREPRENDEEQGLAFAQPVTEERNMTSQAAAPC